MVAWHLYRNLLRFLGILNAQPLIKVIIRFSFPALWFWGRPWRLRGLDVVILVVIKYKLF